MVLRNEFIGNVLVLFWTMCNSVKGQCDIKTFQISTAYDVWFSRYRHSSLMVAPGSALVIVFINFLWTVYAAGLAVCSQMSRLRFEIFDMKLSKSVFGLRVAI